MTLYEELGVHRDASASEIRRAYRKKALLSHPDKNPGDADAAHKFLRVTLAFEVLSNAEKRARYDNGEGDDAHVFDGRDFDSACDVFNEHFGQGLMRQWRPGVSVSGILIANGKRLTITIRPDGTTDETEYEEAAAERVIEHAAAEKEHGEGCQGCCHTDPPERKRATILILEEVAADDRRPRAELTLSSPSADPPASSSSGTLEQLDQEPPRQVPAGYAVGMQLYYAGPSFKSSVNNWLVQGAQGTVVGPAKAALFQGGKGVAVQFPNNKTSIDCYLHELSRSEPPTAMCVTHDAGTTQQATATAT